ncbi:MAG: hypothetical protein Q8M31_22210 [Beijerinckiaceae bacterium]|nr:hypothetical protein [Beijerinckiaceae bacterium]
MTLGLDSGIRNTAPRNADQPLSLRQCFLRHQTPLAEVASERSERRGGLNALGGGTGEALLYITKAANAAKRLPANGATAKEIPREKLNRGIAIKAAAVPLIAAKRSKIIQSSFCQGFFYFHRPLLALAVSTIVSILRVPTLFPTASSPILGNGPATSGRSGIRTTEHAQP